MMPSQTNTSLTPLATENDITNDITRELFELLPSDVQEYIFSFLHSQSREAPLAPIKFFFEFTSQQRAALRTCSKSFYNDVFWELDEQNLNQSTYEENSKRIANSNQRRLRDTLLPLLVFGYFLVYLSLLTGLSYSTKLAVDSYKENLSLNRERASDLDLTLATMLAGILFTIGLSGGCLGGVLAISARNRFIQRPPFLNALKAPRMLSLFAIPDPSYANDLIIEIEPDESSETSDDESFAPNSDDEMRTLIVKTNSLSDDEMPEMNVNNNHSRTYRAVRR